MIYTNNRHYFGLRHEVVLSVAEDANRLVIRSFVPITEKEPFDQIPGATFFHSTDRLWLRDVDGEEGGKPRAITFEDLLTHKRYAQDPAGIDKYRGCNFAFASEQIIDLADKDLMGGALGYSEWSNNTMFLFPIDMGVLGAPYNLTIAGAISKARTMRTLQSFGADCCMQIYVPFEDRNITQVVKSVYANPDLGVVTNIDLGESVTVQDAVAGTARKFLSWMRLTAPQAVQLGGMAECKVEIVDSEGGKVSDCAPEVFIEVTAGYLPKQRVFATGGVATFNVFADRLEAGDAIKVKVGYKNFSGMGEAIIAVTQ